MSLRKVKYPDARLKIGQAAANAIDAPRSCVNMQGILYGLYVTEGQSSVGASYYRAIEEVENQGLLLIDEKVEHTFR